MSDGSKGIRFSIRPTGDSWSWETISPGGTVLAAGLVATRAVAAACVIREICRARSAGDEATVARAA